MRTDGGVVKQVGKVGRRVGLSLTVAGFVAPWTPWQAVAQSAPSQSAPAQSAPTAKTEEVMVTGQRKVERLQKAPVSVTVLSKSVLTNAGVKRAADFVALTPGVSLVAGTAEVGDSQLNIRGINSTRDAGGSFAYVVDGIQISNPADFNREYSNLAQIEVLKGPQGAIYGRNAEAGAVVVTTTMPDNTREVYSRTGVGQFSTVYTQDAVSGALVHDTLFGRLGFDYRTTNGFDANAFLHDKSVDFNRAYNLDGRLVWKPTDDWLVDVKGRYGMVAAGAIDYNAVFELPAFVSTFGPAVNENVNAHQFDYVNNIRPVNYQNTYELSVRAEHDMGFAKLTGYIAYDDIENNLISDGTLATFGFYNNTNNLLHKNTCQSSQAAALASGLTYPAPQSPQFSFLGPYTASTCDGYQYQVRNEDDVSAEIRLASTGKRDLRWSTGAYYLHVDRHVGVSVGDDNGLGIQRSLYNPINSISATAQLYDDQFTTNVFAGFASADYDILPNLTASAAIRYDVEVRDDKNLIPAGNLQDYINVVSGGPANGAFFPLNPGLIANPKGIPSQSVTFQQPEPKATLSWTPVPNATLYATFGIGFKSGGFNSAGTQATVSNIAAETGSDVKVGDRYGKETSKAFEIGLKGTLLDKRLSYQLAGYYTQVNGMQFSEFFSSGQGLLRVVSNIDRVDLQGAELGLQYRLADWLSVGGGGGLTGSEIVKNLSRPDTVGNKSPYTPAYSADIGITVHQPVSQHWAVLARLDTNFVGPTWFHTVQRQSVPTIFGAPGYYAGAERQAYSLTNLRVGLTSKKLELIGFVQNMFDRRYLAEVIPAPEFGGSFASRGPGRLIGGEATVHF